MVALCVIEVSCDELVAHVQRVADSGGHGHIHTTVPGCGLTRRDRRAIVLESTGEGKTYAYFSDEPIEMRAKPLAILLHGAESVPADNETLASACQAVETMAARMNAGKGHFHILNPVCQANPHPGRWTILFEDDEQGPLENVTDERPLADIRLVERLIYAARS
ncbi:MAG: hypothetical protein WCP29_17950 [Acidobacteriota bacterium]